MFSLMKLRNHYCRRDEIILKEPRNSLKSKDNICDIIQTSLCSIKSMLCRIMDVNFDEKNRRLHKIQRKYVINIYYSIARFFWVQYIHINM